MIFSIFLLSPSMCLLRYHFLLFSCLLCYFGVLIWLVVCRKVCPSNGLGWRWDDSAMVVVYACVIVLHFARTRLVLRCFNRQDGPFPMAVRDSYVGVLDR